MRILIYFALIIIAVAFVSFVGAMVLYILDQDELKHRKEQDEEYDQKMITMCHETKKAGQCPHNCTRCAWGTRMVDGVIEFKKNEN